MTDQEHTPEPTLAQRIVTELLTVHWPGHKTETGTRLAIKQEQPDGSERDLGGRCFEAAVDTVEDALQGIRNPSAVRELVETARAVYDYDHEIGYRSYRMDRLKAALDALDAEESSDD